MSSSVLVSGPPGCEKHKITFNYFVALITLIKNHHKLNHSHLVWILSSHIYCLHQHHFAWFYIISKLCYIRSYHTHYTHYAMLHKTWKQVTSKWGWRSRGQNSRLVGRPSSFFHFSLYIIFLINLLERTISLLG
jgi:hypothetical protein